MATRQYYAYILTNRGNAVLYTGVTNNIRKRVWQHRSKMVAGFTQKYNIDKLVYYEVFSDCYSAIGREKQIKAGSRRKKEQLIAKINPMWRDLYEDL